MINNRKCFFKFFLILTSILIIVVTFFDAKKNPTYKLEIISSYGDNEAYHPKILNFSKKWNGYKYWMSYTPYPRGNSDLENPHIAVSNDLINWHAPNNENKPLDEVTDLKARKRYNSDSHIVYNKDKNILICFWRYVDDTKKQVIIYKMESSDGVNWSNKEEVMVSNNRFLKDYVSPVIIYDKNIYKIWYLDVENTLRYAESMDTFNWEDKDVIKFNYPEKLDSWHMDVIKTKKGYEMIVAAYDEWKNHNRMNLYYTKSKDEVHFEDAVLILKPERNTLNFDNAGIYRSSFIYQDGYYYLYYGAVSYLGERGIGFAYGKKITNLKRDKTNYKDPKEVKKLIKKLNVKKTKVN